MSALITRMALIAALAAPLAGCGADGEPITPTTRTYGGVNVTVSGDATFGVVRGWPGMQRRP